MATIGGYKTLTLPALRKRIWSERKLANCAKETPFLPQTGFGDPPSHKTRIKVLLDPTRICPCAQGIWYSSPLYSSLFIIPTFYEKTYFPWHYKQTHSLLISYHKSESWNLIIFVITHKLNCRHIRTLRGHSTQESRVRNNAGLQFRLRCR